MKRYPLGIQTFKELITKDYLYVDKTHLVYKLTHEFKYAFLSRPRRFGKSLLVSTLESYFEGKKELFKGLAIESLEKEWIEYPVLRFDFSTTKINTNEAFISELNIQLSEYEAIWGKNEEEIYPGQRLRGLVKRAFAKTNKPVAVLIDEYDAQLLNVIDNQESLQTNRESLRDFFSPLKNLDPYLKFVFITGITKFAQLSLFSELNNLVNISMLPEYATICGITKVEMLGSFQDGINELAVSKGISYDDVVELLQKNYDGYHFTYPSPDIYNPFSLLYALSTKQIDSYWFSSGGTRLAIYALQENNIGPDRLLEPFNTKKALFDKPFEKTDDVIPLLYQSGYLTIKDYDKEYDTYSLSLPNNEVKISLFETLLPYYIKQDFSNSTLVEDIAKGLKNDDLNLVFTTMQKVFSSVPQCNNTDYEGHYQSMFCLIFTLLGQYVDAEVRTPNGRVDVVINNKKKVYLFEFKLNESAETALEQIEKKDYAQKFILLGLPTVKIGVNFNSETRNIDDWIVFEN